MGYRAHEFESFSGMEFLSYAIIFIKDINKPFLCKGISNRKNNNNNFLNK